MMQLVAVGADGRHALGARFRGLAPGGVYRVAAWVKVEPGTQIMIEIRDSLDPYTARPSNYGVARVDPAAGSITTSTGDLLASGVERLAGQWVKVWGDLRNKDGEIFVSLSLLEGPNERHVFKAAGQVVTFGGFEISPPRVPETSRGGAAAIDLPATNVDQLPPLSDSSSGPDQWDLIEGLHATIIEAGDNGSDAVPSQGILRLAAVGSDGRHALGARFRGLGPGKVYRALAWVKMESGDRVMMEARDSVDRQTGKPANYGAAQFNLDDRSGSGMTGDALASGAESAFGGWTRIWIDLQSNDGQIFIVLGLLEGSNGRHVFAASGQNVIFGGFQIAEPGSSPPESISVAPITHIEDLPLLSETSSVPSNWDLFEGLSAEVVQGPPVAHGQPVLKLIAVGTDGRHALGIRFADLSPGVVYRASAWVKTRPGVQIMIEVRDAVEQASGSPSSYGIAQFHPSAQTIVNSRGDIIAAGAEATASGWVQVWVDLRVKNGQMFASIALLESPNNRHVFKAAGQELIFGGFQILSRGPP